MKRSACLAYSLLVFASVTLISSCGGGGGAAAPQFTGPVSVTVSASVFTVEAGGTSVITATVINDSSGKGVTWTISPASGAGILTNESSISVTYQAPASPPPSDVTVTITATSVAAPSASGFVMIDFAAVSVSLSASMSPVGAGGTSLITAQVSNDPANKGVSVASWKISPASGAGTLSKLSSTSATYNAPATPPASDVQVTITATSVTDPTKSGNVVITFAAIAVSLSANPSSVAAQGTSTITATVSFDPKNAGVNPASWMITSPALGGGTLTSPTNTSVTYTAPGVPVASNLSVTITATSASDPTKSNSTTVTVLAITISISPGSALIPVNQTQPFTAMIHNDPTASPQVNWAVSQGGSLCSTGCGSFAPATTPSGTPSTYTAPAAVPANPMVTPTATSASDTTKSAGATVTISNGTVMIVPNILNFGEVKTNQTRSMVSTLTNTGSSALSISSTTFSGTGAGAFSLTANTCGTSVSAGKSCNLTVTFKPVNTIAYVATLSIKDSSSDSPQQVSLSGTGIQRRIRSSAVLAALASHRTETVPEPEGPNSVGTRVMNLVDSSRNDPFLANGSKRELLVRFWYPAAAAQNRRRADYTWPLVWSYFSQLVGVPLPRITTNSWKDSSVAVGRHPVVIFTHGYTGTFTDYTFIFEDLASRGYVVASVDHTFEATAVEFPDGRFARSVFGSYLGSTLRSDEPAMDFALSARLGDLKFVVDELERMNGEAKSPFAGKLDMSRLAVAGHSLGGLAAFLAVEEESRFRAGILLDGAVPNSSLPATDTPILLLAAGRDTWSDDERRLWSELHGPRFAVNLTGAEHLAPSDAVWMAMGAIDTGAMGPEKTMSAVRNYIAAFLDANLRGEPINPLLTGPSPDYPGAVVTKQTESLRSRP